MSFIPELRYSANLPGMRVSGYRAPLRTGLGGVLVDKDGANQAIGQIGSALASQTGQFARAYGDAIGGAGIGNMANAYANNTGHVSQGMAGIGNSLANTYGSMAGGLGSVANAMANERGNFYSSNAMAEAARQGALGNLATAALSGYGGAANAAMAGWAQNQNAYNQALSNLGVANQTGLAGLGSSRNAALGQLGQSYADLGGRLAGAAVLQGMDFGFGGGGGGGSFTATGPDGLVASGSYGPSASGGSWMRSSTGDVGRYSDQAFGGLNNLRQDAMAGDITGAMNNNLQDGMNRLDMQHFSSRGMPSQMLGQTLSGLMQLGRQGYGNIRSGMNQFYATQNDPRNRGEYSGILDRLSSGYDQARESISPLADRIQGAFSTSNAGIGRSQALGGAMLKDAFSSLRGLYRDSNLGRMFQAAPPTPRPSYYTPPKQKP